MREAIILAGGFGTRLSHVVPDVCKPMAPVAGQPFLRIILNQLSASKFDRVVVADGYRREQIEGYFGQSYRGMEIVYSPEDSPLLTGGAVKRAMHACSSDYVFVLNGDTYCDVDFSKMEQLVKSSPSSPDAIIAIKEMYRYSRYGSVEIDKAGVIERFLEKRFRDRGFVNAGTYLLRKNALSSMPDVFSLEQDYFENGVSENVFLACVTSGQFIDIGVPEDYYLAQDMLKSLVKGWKIAFFDRDGTINVDTGHLFEPEKLELISQTIPILRYFSARQDYKVVVVTNQAGIAKGLYGVAEMRDLHKVLDSRLSDYDCRIDAYYYCPHHPEITGTCACRKPNPGMIVRAMKDFNADPCDCVMFGDKDSDRQAALDAGIRYAMVDGEHSLSQILESWGF